MASTKSKAKQSKKMTPDCSCDWCTTPTHLHNNNYVNLPCYIRFGQGRESEKAVIACMYNIRGEDASVLFPDGSRFHSLTSAGKYAHSAILKKTTSDGNNGWKRWRINLKFGNGIEKTVVLKTLKEAGVAIKNGSVNQIRFKSNFCVSCEEKVAAKTVIQMISPPSTPDKRKCVTIEETSTKKVKIDQTIHENTSMEVDEEINEEDVDLNTFMTDVDKISGDTHYNKIVYGREHIPFSNVTEDENDNSYFVCTLKDKFVNVVVPKHVLLSLHQYKNSSVLEPFRINMFQ